jgi:hypothetical protein
MALSTASWNVRFCGLCGCVLNIHIGMIKGFIFDNMNEILQPLTSPKYARMARFYIP